jgi:hypothetical protein
LGDIFQKKMYPTRKKFRPNGEISNNLVTLAPALFSSSLTRNKKKEREIQIQIETDCVLKISQRINPLSKFDSSEEVEACWI